jgi:4-amino-4-deoxy-L-arabinose transferase-like glycosyltransferase
MSERKFVFLVALIAFALRLGFTAAYRGGLDQPPTHARCAADGVEYDSLARSVAAGRGFCWDDGTPTSFRAPGLPLAMAAVYTIFGGSYVPIHIFFSVCGVLNVIGTYCFTRELLDVRRARIAMILAAIYRPDVYMASNFLSEIVFVPCLAFGLYFLVRSSRKPSSWGMLMAGLLLGCGSLSRSFAILLLPILCFDLVRTCSWKAAIIYAVGFLAVLLPWTARNYSVHGKFVLVSTNGGSTFYGGNNPVVAGQLWQHGNWVSTTLLPGRDLIEAQPNEVAHDQMEYKLGREWVQSNPLAFAKLGIFKVIRFWTPFIHWPSFKVYPVANIGSTAPFLALILLGLIRTLVRPDDRRLCRVCHLTLVGSMIMVVIFWGDPRFRDANLPILMVYAVFGWDWVVGTKTKQEFKKPATDVLTAKSS